jgi:hypothetical protein
MLSFQQKNSLISNTQKDTSTKTKSSSSLFPTSGAYALSPPQKPSFQRSYFRADAAVLLQNSSSKIVIKNLLVTKLGKSERKG